VRTTIVGGRVLMEDRKMLTLDEAAILVKAAQYQRQIRSTLP
jgi:hypothetical protein